MLIDVGRLFVVLIAYSVPTSAILGPSGRGMASHEERWGTAKSNKSKSSGAAPSRRWRHKRATYLAIGDDRYRLCGSVSLSSRDGKRRHNDQDRSLPARTPPLGLKQTMNRPSIMPKHV